MLLPLLMYGLILWLSQRLDAFDMWSLRKILRIPCTRRNHQRHCQRGYIPFALQFVLLFKKSALFLWYKRISSRITTESLMSRFDHHLIGEDLKGTHVPPGWGELMLTYNRPTLRSSQPGGRTTSDVSSRHVNTPVEARRWRRRMKLPFQSGRVLPLVGCVFGRCQSNCCLLDAVQSRNLWRPVSDCYALWKQTWDRCSCRRWTANAVTVYTAAMLSRPTQ